LSKDYAFNKTGKENSLAFIDYLNTSTDRLEF
jgi:hypothetical protein